LPVAFLQTLNVNRFLAAGRGWALTAVYAAGLVTNVGLNLYLIPRFAHNGCAVATVAGEAVVWVVSTWLLREKRP
jgi:O-antigen/teichoic acid export membrane protein